MTLTFALVGMVLTFLLGWCIGALAMNVQAVREQADLRRLCEERLDRETARLCSERDALLDRMQAKSLAELEATKLMRTQGPPTTEPLQIDEDWESPSFNNRPKVQQLPEHEDA